MHRPQLLAVSLVMALPLLILATALVAGQADAAHTHDHRYVVTGRLLDDAGKPACCLTVRASVEGADDPAASVAVQTNCFGDFVAAVAVGGLAGAEVRVDINDETFRSDVDPHTRRTFVRLTVNGTWADPACSETRANFLRNHFVVGRVLTADGRPIGSQRVLVTVELDDGTSRRGNGTSNAAGDYAIRFPDGPFDQPGTAVVRIEDDEARVQLDTAWGITVADRTAPATNDSPAPAALAALAVLALAAALRRRRSS